MTISDQAARIMIYGLTKSGGGKGDLTCTKLLTGAPLSSLLPSIAIPQITTTARLSPGYSYRAGNGLGTSFYPVALTTNYTDSQGMQHRITDLKSGKVLTGAALTAETTRRKNLFNQLKAVFDQNGKPSKVWQNALASYTMTDYGAKIIAKVVTENQRAITDGLIYPLGNSKAGQLTIKGLDKSKTPTWVKNEPTFYPSNPGLYKPFKLVSTAYSGGRDNGRPDTGVMGNYAFVGTTFVGDAQLAQGIALLDAPRTTYEGTLSVFLVSIIHHEFGHTRFGDRGAGSTSATYGTSKDPLELVAVDRYENPVRLMNGYVPKPQYTSSGRVLGCSIYRARGAPCP